MTEQNVWLNATRSGAEILSKPPQPRTEWHGWVVTDDGLLHRPRGYFIEAHRLDEDWVPQLMNKRWTGLGFLPAYVAACDRHGVDTERAAAARLLVTRR